MGAISPLFVTHTVAVWLCYFPPAHAASVTLHGNEASLQFLAKKGASLATWELGFDSQHLTDALGEVYPYTPGAHHAPHVGRATADVVLGPDHAEPPGSEAAGELTKAAGSHRSFGTLTTRLISWSIISLFVLYVLGGVVLLVKCYLQFQNVREAIGDAHRQMHATMEATAKDNELSISRSDFSVFGLGTPRRHEEHQHLGGQRDGDDDKCMEIHFSEYVWYRFTNWFAWSTYSKDVIITSVVFLFMVVFSTIYFFSTGKTWAASVFVVFGQLVEPDGGKGATSFEGQMVCGAASLAGLVIFAVLIAYVQDRFNDFLERMKDGMEPVVEEGHFVLLGWTDHTFTLITELAEAYSDEGGCKIAILCDDPKTTVEEYLQQDPAKLQGTRIVVRQGKAYSAEDLRRVGVPTCRTVVILTDTKLPLEARDTQTIRTLLTLRSEGWPLRKEGSGLPEAQQLIVHCAKMRNYELMQRLGGDCATVVSVEDFIGRTLVQCSRHVGISTVVKQLLGFQGSEFYIIVAPECVHGKNFLSSLCYFPNCILAGIVTDFGKDDRGRAIRRFLWYKECVELGEGSGYRFRENDEIVLFAENAADIEPCMDVEQHQSYLEEGLGTKDDHWHQGCLNDLIETGLYGPPTLPGGGVAKAGCAHASRRTRPERETEHLLLEQHRRRTQTEDEYKASMKAETVVFFGWNETMWHVVSEIDKAVGPNSTVVSYSQVPANRRQHYFEKQQTQHDVEFSNISMLFVDGVLGSRHQMEQFVTGELKDILKQATRVFVLTDMDPNGGVPSDPDSGVVGTILHVRSLFRQFLAAEDPSPTESARAVSARTRNRLSIAGARRIRELPIIAEIRENESEEHCENIHVMDYVNSATISAQILAMLARDVKINDMLTQLTSEEASMTFEIRDLSHYEGGDILDISFLRAMRLGLNKGELVIGWTRPPTRRGSGSGLQKASFLENMEESSGLQSSPGRRCLEWEMNPRNKAAIRAWSYSDRLAVLCPRFSAENDSPSASQVGSETW